MKVLPPLSHPAAAKPQLSGGKVAALACLTGAGYPLREASRWINDGNLLRVDGWLGIVTIERNHP